MHSYSYASFISIIMANFIRNLGWRARPLPSFNAPYIVPPVFVDGLDEILSQVLQAGVIRNLARPQAMGQGEFSLVAFQIRVMRNSRLSAMPIAMDSASWAGAPIRTATSRPSS